MGEVCAGMERCAARSLCGAVAFQETRVTAVTAVKLPCLHETRGGGRRESGAVVAALVCVNRAVAARGHVCALQQPARGRPTRDSSMID